MNFQTKFATTVASFMLLYPALFGSAEAAQKPIVYSPASVDLGAAPDAAVVDVTLSLNLVDRAGLERFVASTTDRNSRSFRKFLTPQQFAARYGQPDAAVARVRSYLEAQGMTVTQVFDNKLVISAKASNAQLSATFATPIHSYVENGVTSQRPTYTPVIPAAIQDVVGRVAGLSTRPAFHTHLRSIPADIQPLATERSTSRASPAATIPTPGIPGQYTVGDLAKQYNITPIYKRGITGAGKTLGIMTFANFNTTDVGVYWGAVGISSSVSRITVVNTVPGSSISSDGADETTLDVEQSGGVAPGANVIVYEAPNTDAGALALYAKAINDNLADTLSISWGEAELYYANPDDLAPYDALFLQSAAQGVPISASSGDEGAYDLNYTGAFPYPSYAAALSLDYPSSSPYVIAAGGTTLPVTLNLSHGTVVVAQERPWGWDYLRDYLITNNSQSYYYTNFFPVGGGGGVSVQYPVPSYQAGLAGVQTSAPGQALFCLQSPAGADPNNGPYPCTPGPVTDELPGGSDLPAGYAGRNTPDVALNADPETGYTLYYNGKYSKGFGGTSFVAPQLNGIFALISQQIGGRIGWPHPQLYNAFKAKGYGAGSPFRAITAGSNLFYTAGPSFNPASGLGSLDVDNLATALTH